MLFAMRLIPSEKIVIRKPEADICRRSDCLQKLTMLVFHYAFQRTFVFIEVV